MSVERVLFDCRAGASPAKKATGAVELMILLDFLGNEAARPAVAPYLRGRFCGAYSAPLQ
jgi:hypothetical protein